ncbi:MAG: hypothetical protein H7Z11_24680 [Verrucomicrobia bacterium]|nr:hypothetical protein [Leptolyngbya sp. ES-bin-22]
MSAIALESITQGRFCFADVSRTSLRLRGAIAGANQTEAIVEAKKDRLKVQE